VIEAKYSMLMFFPELLPDNLFEIKESLKSGVKVYLLTFDAGPFSENDPFLKNAMDKGLLSFHLVRYQESYQNRMVLILDGKYQDSNWLDFFDEHSSFNKEQYILEHESNGQHCIVKAGAGTGKTTTMINRLMFLKHKDPSLSLENIVMITFTNEAASHMRGKVMEKLKNYYELTRNQKYLEWMEETGSMFIGTIHAFAKEFLVLEGRNIGFSRLMQIRSYRHDRRKAIEKYIDLFSVEYPDIYRQFKYIPHYKLVAAFEVMIERMQNKSIGEDAIQEVDFGFDAIGLHQFASYVIKSTIQELKNKKLADDTLELSDLISRLGQLRLLDKKDIKLTLKYLFVDEFQDTDETQVSFISWMVSMYTPQLFAVGDIKQSIYRFRGADYTAFKQLKTNLETMNSVFLEVSLRKNYRSEPLLLSNFNRLFSKWSKKVDRFEFNTSDKLIPVFEDTTKEGLNVLKLDDMNLQNVLKRLEGKDVALLVRSNRQVLDTVSKLEGLGYFCEASVSGSFFRSQPVREFYLLIRSLTHPKVAKDQYLFHRSSYGENNLTIAQILNEFTYDKQQILDQLSQSNADVVANVNFKNSSALFMLQSIIEEVHPHDVFRKRYYQKLRENFPYRDAEMQKKEAVAKSKEYKVNLDHLLFLLKKEFGDFQASLYDLEKYLSIKMATDQIETEWKLEDDVSHRFKVMTVHKAKGLEFEYVILPLTDSLFIKNSNSDIILLPDHDKWTMGYRIDWGENVVANTHYQLNEVSEKNETVGEESRLLYVALTRAKIGVIANGSSRMSDYDAKCWNDLLESGEMQLV
jgi:DNA helicase II / ATP-dependent DNA helicase PcrA